VSPQRIRQALIELEKDGLPRHALRALVISEDGQLFFQPDPESVYKADPGRQVAMPGMLNLVSPYQDRGPDLLEPRPLLRIVPGKLHGEPHVVHTRIPTAVLFELFSEGYNTTQIQAMYPDISSEALQQAIDLEQTLSGAA
jgi:uncharacterized protein (DUF433 family)